MRSVTVLGATGSVGQSTLDLIGRDPDAYAVEALTGAGNVARLAEDAVRLRARIAVTAREECWGELRDRLAGTGVEAAAGAAAVAEAAARPADWTMGAIVGVAGLVPNLAALAGGGVLALANKETMVAAGPLVMAAARGSGATILPVDSEHSGVFQALRGERLEAVERVILTASGGAFRDWPAERIARATPEEASQHPTWTMGRRITVDSASMFNKALEVLEARELFGLRPEQVEVLVHRESVVHAVVCFRDGGMIAHLGCSDMRHAIGFALHHPERADLPVERLDLAALGRLSFEQPDEARWPALRLARRAMEEGGLAGAVLNGAKERALDLFLDRRLSFPGMAAVVARVMDRAARDDGMPQPLETGADLGDVLEADRLARLWADEAAALVEA